MDIYNYSPDTNEFTYQALAIINPRNSSDFLIPSYATNVVPPRTNENEVAVFNTDLHSWNVDHDFRGERVYLKSDPSINATWKVIGSVSEEFTLEVPNHVDSDIWDYDTNKWVLNLNGMKDLKIQEVKDLANNKIKVNYPIWKQINMIRKMSKLSKRENLGWITLEELDDLEFLELEWSVNIDDVREASDLIEEEILKLSVGTDIEGYDVTNNVLWP